MPSTGSTNHLNFWGTFGGFSLLAAAGTMFTAFLGTMFVFVLIAIELHLRRLSGRANLIPFDSSNYGPGGTPSSKIEPSLTARRPND